jgi:hypothetical protein
MASASPTLITPKFVFAYPLSPNVSDYRCVVNADATAVIVERTTFTAGGSVGPQLCLFDLTKGGAEPTFLLPGIDISTRPDWSWTTGRIAFNYAGSVMVGVLQAPGQSATLFGPPTAQMDYPTWFPDGTMLATEDGNGSPSPNTTTIDASTGAIIQTALEGKNYWGGMPSVNPVSPNLIAFAGQAVSGPTYDQDKNYIYVMDTSSSDGPVPLESGAPEAGRSIRTIRAGHPAGRRTASGSFSNRTGRRNMKRTASTPFICMSTSAPGLRCRSPARSTIATTPSGFRTASPADRPAHSS